MSLSSQIKSIPTNQKDLKLKFFVFVFFVVAVEEGVRKKRKSTIFNKRHTKA